MVNCRLCAWAESTWSTQYFWWSWCVSSIWSKVKPVFCLIWQFDCTYNLLRCLHLEIWQFSCGRQRKTYKTITLPLAHVRGVIILHVGRVIILTTVCASRWLNRNVTLSPSWIISPKLNRKENHLWQECEVTCKNHLAILYRLHWLYHIVTTLRVLLSTVVYCVLALSSLVPRPSCVFQRCTQKNREGLVPGQFCDEMMTYWTLFGTRSYISPPTRPCNHQHN